MVFNLDSKHAMVFQSFFSWTDGFCEKKTKKMNMGLKLLVKICSQTFNGLASLIESLHANFQG